MSDYSIFLFKMMIIINKKKKKKKKQFFPKSDKSGTHYYGTRDTDAFLKYLDVNTE